MSFAVQLSAGVDHLGWGGGVCTSWQPYVLCWFGKDNIKVNIYTKNYLSLSIVDNTMKKFIWKLWVIFSQLLFAINHLHKKLVAMKIINKTMIQMRPKSSSFHFSDSKWISIFLRVSTGMCSFVFLSFRRVFACPSLFLYFSRCVCEGVRILVYVFIYLAVCNLYPCKLRCLYLYK